MFPQAQVEATIALCRDIISRHAIRPERILAHSDIAPTRKRDPGERFPWALSAHGAIHDPRSFAIFSIARTCPLAKRTKPRYLKAS